MTLSEKRDMHLVAKVCGQQAPFSVLNCPNSTARERFCKPKVHMGMKAELCGAILGLTA